MLFRRKGGRELQQGSKIARRKSFGQRESRSSLLIRSESGTLNHGLDWLDASDGLLREREAESDSPEQFTAYINRAATHTLQNSRLGQRATAQPGQDDGLPWAEILEDSEDLDLEFLDPIPQENGLANASQSRVDILNWEEVLTGGKRD